MSDIDRLKRELFGIRVEDNPALVKQKSRDFYWYSPVLKKALDHVTGDLVVTPASEDEIIRTLRACHALGIPVTARGSGTGNYGQAMPLSGGVVLNLAGMNRVLSIEAGRFTAEPGAVLADIDRQTRRHSRQEIRLSPSTYQTASVAGFLAGGSGGIGSVRWGGLRNLGNVLKMRVVTMEAEPRVLDLSGWDLHKVLHAYGTNGIITEVEMPLTEAYDWIEILAGFDRFADAAAFAMELGNADGILVKELAAIAAPVPHDYFARYRKFIRRDQSVAVVMVAPHAVDAFEALAARSRAETLYRSDRATAEDKKGLPPIYELTWNHTTLRALRVDPSITYLQSLYTGPDALAKLANMEAMFGDEVPGHIEISRFDGRVAALGLPLLRYTTEERLDEIVRLHEDNGVPVFNPHRYTLEEGGMKQTDAAQLAFKRETDPKGLLNPGKMIGWENPDFDLNAGGFYLFPALAGKQAPPREQAGHVMP